MSDTSFTLQYPSADEFTHTELAQHNGKTNQQVWTRLQAALQSGDLIFSRWRPQAAGKRGKPSKLYARKGFVTPNAPATSAVNTTPATPVVAAVAPVNTVPTEPVETQAVPPAPEPTPEPAAEDDNVIYPSEEQIEAATVMTNPAPVVVDVVPVVEIQPMAPAVAPVVAETTPAPETAAVVVETKTTEQAQTLADKCPVCDHPLQAIKDATGFMVWCGQGPDICQSTESPYGHAKSIKDALTVLREKWGFALKNS